MSKKKYLRTSINFGDPGTFSRTIIEDLQKRKIDVSDFVRRAVVVFANVNNPALAAKVKKESLVQKYKQQARAFKEANDTLRLYREECEKAGIDLDDELY